MAVQAANDIVQQAAARGRAITLEWSAIAALLAAGVALGLGVWYRHLALTSLGSAAWGGLVVGALLCHAALQQGRARLSYLALAIFAGLPLAAIPFRFVSPEAGMLPLLVLGGLGVALMGGGLRWAWEIRGTVGTLQETAGQATASLGKAMSAMAAWLHDAIIKWIFVLLLGGVGAGVAFVARVQRQELMFWAGAALVFLVGSVGLWAPGLYQRGRLPVGLRHCGQLCFWLSLLVVPFVELGPDGMLPYTAHPSLRFIAMGLGLVIVGSTWFLQKGSIFSHPIKLEPKRSAERAYSLAIVILGLLVLLGGAEVRQRMKLAVDQSVISHTDPLSRVQFQPPAQVRSLVIVQPLENVPIYLDDVQFQDGTSMRLIPLLYPGEQLRAYDHGLVKAIRAAAKLNVQRSMPESRMEVWTPSEGPKG